MHNIVPATAAPAKDPTAAPIITRSEIGSVGDRYVQRPGYKLVADGTVGALNSLQPVLGEGKTVRRDARELNI